MNKYNINMDCDELLQILEGFDDGIAYESTSDSEVEEEMEVCRF